MQAYDELQRVRHCLGFTVNSKGKRNVNQHMRAYEFDDGSVLKIYRNGRATAQDCAGYVHCISSIRANAFGQF